MRARNCFLVFVCVFFTQTVFACTCAENFTASDKNQALSDSQNGSFSTDTSFLNKTLQEVRTSDRCCIATIQSIKEQLISPFSEETLTIHCVRTLKGKTIPTHFTVLNRLGTENCMGSAKQLKGIKFICFLPSNSLPGQLADCGIKPNSCGGLDGVFITEKRLVSFLTKCGSNGSLCWDYAVNADINDFTNAIKQIPAESKSEKTFKSSKGNTAFSLDGQNIAKREDK